MNGELNFVDVSKSLTVVWQGDTCLGYIKPGVGVWVLTNGYGAELWRGRRSKVRQYAVEIWCECADCLAGKKAEV